MLARMAPEDTTAALKALRARADVVYAEPNFIRQADAVPNDPRYSDLFGLKNSSSVAGGTSAESAWDTSTGNQNVVVGVIDSGIDIEKPQAVTATQLKNEFIILTIAPTGEVWYDRNNIGVEGVRSTVAALLLSEERPVVIQADKRATTEVLVRVMDEAKLAGAKTLNIATAVE